jgi:hypothetical protein
MPTRTRWHGPIAVADDGDPFAARVEQLGMPIKLSEGRAELVARLAELVEQEGLLWNAGVRCGIKDLPDVTCSACPLSAHDDDGSPMQALCLVGRAQEQVLTRSTCIRELGDVEKGSE